MRLLLVLLAAAAAVSAHEGHEAATDFRKECDCPDPVVPPFLNDKAKCEFLANHEVFCYKKSNGGCPQPVAKSC